MGFMIIEEPIRETTEIPDHRNPSVLAAVVDDQLDGASQLPRLRLEPLGLVERHQRIGVAMID
jgi:hypothetical protein